MNVKSYLGALVWVMCMLNFMAANYGTFQIQCMKMLYFARMIICPPSSLFLYHQNRVRQSIKCYNDEKTAILLQDKPHCDPGRPIWWPSWPASSWSIPWTHQRAAGCESLNLCKISLLNSLKSCIEKYSLWTDWQVSSTFETFQFFI